MVSYEYFMDEMEMYEISICLNEFAYSSKSNWEQARLIAFYSLLPNLDKNSKNKTPQKLIPLVTDEIDKIETEAPEKQEFDRVMQLAKTVNINELNTEDIKIFKV